MQKIYTFRVKAGEASNKHNKRTKERKGLFVPSASVHVHTRIPYTLTMQAAKTNNVASTGSARCTINMNAGVHPVRNRRCNSARASRETA